MKRSLLLFSLLIGINQIYAQKMKPQDTEVWEPEPVVVTPGEGTAPPSDAIILFDGTNLDNWESTKGGEAKWEVSDGAMTTVKGAGGIRSKVVYGDCQLHIEWRTPAEVEGKGQGRGNSGVFLQGIYEVQVLDSYENRTYSNGQAASIYKQSMPLVNACKPPGEWQTYDIIYRAPIFDEDGKLATPAYITVIQNGILVQNHYQIKGDTPYIGLPKYEAHGEGPLMLQDHSNPVSFRNIWLRKL
ncbi:MAG: DUF1080 domain-containing protein [Cyclobacteriaceae bacterium]|jgi:hypothetical protein